MSNRMLLALALVTLPAVALPAAALAQAVPTQGPVSVEIVTSGEVKVPAQRFRFSVKLTGKGQTEEDAGKALADNREKLVGAMTARNIKEAQPLDGPPNSMLSLFAGLAGRSKPSFSVDPLADLESEEKPQSVAKETVIFDAPNRAAVESARSIVEANGGTIEDEVVAMLDDYADATRRAKADAIAKARSEATAYAATLGLRQAAVTKISERQDIVAGSLGFVTQLIGMFAPKPAASSDTVSVQANLTVEFQLTR